MDRFLDWRLTILRAATHATERGDHDFCLSRSHEWPNVFMYWLDDLYLEVELTWVDWLIPFFIEEWLNGFTCWMDGFRMIALIDSLFNDWFVGWWMIKEIDFLINWLTVEFIDWLIYGLIDLSTDHNYFEESNSCVNSYVKVCWIHYVVDMLIRCNHRLDDW